MRYVYHDMFEAAIKSSDYAPASANRISLLAYDLSASLGNKIDPSRSGGPRTTQSVLSDITRAQAVVALYARQDLAGWFAALVGAGLIAGAILLLPNWVLAIGIPLLVLGGAFVGYTSLLTCGVASRIDAKAHLEALRTELMNTQEWAA